MSTRPSEKRVNADDECAGVQLDKVAELRVDFLAAFGHGREERAAFGKTLRLGFRQGTFGFRQGTCRLELRHACRCTRFCILELETATDAEVRAGAGIIGSQPLGGGGQIDVRSGKETVAAPLNAHGIAGYARVAMTRPLLWRTRPCARWC
jgi:hypothetical protein